MTDTVTETEQKFKVGELVHYLLAEVADLTIDPAADAATISTDMDRVLGEAMNVELTVRELLNAAVTALKYLSEAR